MEVDPVTELKVQIAVLQTQLNSIIVSVTELKNDLRAALVKVSEDSVSQTEYTLVKRIVFGLAGIVLVTVATEVVKFFVGKK